MKTIKNWGNYPCCKGKEVFFQDHAALDFFLKKYTKLTPRGLGRCYGDSSLGETILNTTQFNRIISFDTHSGQLICESGCSLAQILDLIVPQGWFLPVTPGSKFITMGGAVAANVHGKNHHIAGCLSQHLTFLDIHTSQGYMRCSSKTNKDLFNASCGGMGLTGLITQIGIQLIPIKSAYIRQKNIIAKNLSDVMTAFDTYQHWPYSVAWIDCLQQGASLGRAVLMLGELIQEDSLPLSLPRKYTKSIPFYMPSWVLNRWTMKAFNQSYFTWQSLKKDVFITDYDHFFYPLDAFHHWNRLYGKTGFLQYQCVLPLKSSYLALQKILQKVSCEGNASFLAVLKKFAPQNDLISFPMEGYTLALDFPMTQKALALLDELDKIVLENKGRVYLAKDARMSSKMFHQSYLKSHLFIEKKRQWDPKKQFASQQSERLNIQ